MDTNRMITIEELKVGDEILIPKNSQLRYAKVLRRPQQSKTRYSWRPTIIRWKNVKCALRVKSEEFVFGNTSQYKRTIISNPPDEDLPIIEESLNLNFKDIWLVKREEV